MPMPGLRLFHHAFTAGFSMRRKLTVRCGKPTLNEDHCPRNHGFQIYVSLPCGPWVSTCFFFFSITKRKKKHNGFSDVKCEKPWFIYQWMWWGMLHCHLDYQRVLPGPRNSYQREIREGRWYFNDNPDVPFGPLVIWNSNGKSIINGALNGKIICQWAIFQSYAK